MDSTEKGLGCWRNRFVRIQFRNLVGTVLFWQRARISNNPEVGRMNRKATKPFALAALLFLACATGGTTTNSASSTATPQQYTMQDFYANTSYQGGFWSSDGKHILLSSNATGIWNAYTIPATGGPAVPLTQSTTNSIFAQSYFPADDRVLYSSDQGGNQLTPIYVRNPAGAVP